MFAPRPRALREHLVSRATLGAKSALVIVASVEFEPTSRRAQCVSERSIPAHLTDEAMAIARLIAAWTG